MTCLNCVDKDVQKLSMATRPLEHFDLVSVREGELRVSNSYSTARTSTRDLNILHSELFRRCSFERAIAETKIKNGLPFDFLLSFPRTTEVQYRSGTMRSTIRLGRTATYGRVVAPSVSVLSITRSTNVLKEMGSRLFACTFSSQTSNQLRHEKNRLCILLGSVHIVRRFRCKGSRKVKCKKRFKKEYKRTEPRSWKRKY